MRSGILTDVVIRRVNEVASRVGGLLSIWQLHESHVDLKGYLVYRTKIYIRRKHHYHSF